MTTLKDTMPDSFNEDDKAWKYKDINVTKVHCSFSDGYEHVWWPGTHKNVFYWVELENGYAVGWNENPSKGYSFPIKKMPETEN